MFVMEIFKPRLLSSNASRLYTRLTALHLLQSPALPCFLCGEVNSLMNVLEGECSWLCLLEVSINVEIVVYIHFCRFVYFVAIYSCSVCCCIFIFHLFMLVLGVILNTAIICKQVHCFIFVWVHWQSSG